MPALGLQAVGPEPVEHLLSQLQEDRRLPRVRRPLGAAGRRGQQRHPNAVDAQIDHLCRSARFQLTRSRLARGFQSSDTMHSGSVGGVAVRVEKISTPNWRMKQL
jgi:hypothetical protein